MNNLESERIELIPLTAEQLRLWTDAVQALENQLGCCYKGEPAMGSFVDFIRKQACIVEKDPVNYLYHTLWSQPSVPGDGLYDRGSESTVKVGSITRKC